MIKKWVLKFLAKHYISVEALKSIDHAMNRKFADRVKLEGKETVVATTNDITTCLKARLDGYADDGHIDETELGRINGVDDAMIDRYFTDEKIAAIIEAVLR